MTPLVSILVPAYNAAAWLAQTLRSATEQTWGNKEIIVVNDGSRDQTLSVARQFQSNMVRVVSQENQGAAATRNHLFALAQGDFVQWLDADDLLAPEKIAKQMEVAGRCGRRTLFSAPFGKFLYRPHRARFNPTPLWENLSPTEWLIRKMSLDVHMQTGTWLVSRELTQVAGPWNTQLLGDDDGEYFCRVLLQSDGVQFVPTANTYYRGLGTSSLSYIGRSDRKRDAQWRSMLLHVEYLRSLEDSVRTRAACVNYLQNWLVFFYPERMDLVRQAEGLAVSLGGELAVPRLSWKYAWIQAVAGRKSANRVQVISRNLRWRCAGACDKAALHIETLGHSPQSRA